MLLGLSKLCAVELVSCSIVCILAMDQNLHVNPIEVKVLSLATVESCDLLQQEIAPVFSIYGYSRKVDDDSIRLHRRFNPMTLIISSRYEHKELAGSIHTNKAR